MPQKLFRARSSAEYYLPQIENYLLFLRSFELPDYTRMDPAARLPGIVLEKFSVTRPSMSDDASFRYLEGIKEHDRIIPRIRHALATHAESAALLYLAFGQYGVESMENGKSFFFHGFQVQAHHVLPKEVEAVGSVFGNISSDADTRQIFPLHVNDLRNYAFVPGNGYFTHDGKQAKEKNRDFHQFFHAITNPQTDGPVDEPYDFYVPRPVFPFYPPLREPMWSEEKIRKGLVEWKGRQQGLDIDLFINRWGKNLAAFGECMEHDGYFVPEPQAEVARGQFVFPGLSANLDYERKVELANNSLAARYLPHGYPYGSATVHGVKLDPFQDPEIEMEVFTKSYSSAMERQPKMVPRKSIQREEMPSLALAVNSGIGTRQTPRGKQYSLPLGIPSEVPF